VEPTVPVVRDDGPSYVVEGPECAAAREKARSDPPPADLYPVKTRGMSIILLPAIPDTAITVTIRFVVDSAGNEVKAGRQIITSRVLPRTHMRLIERTADAFRFHPAVLSGCGVAGAYAFSQRIRR
jgi:hypothetical protein